ncbi:hypothetical protein ACI7MO_09620 [Bacillus paranthracis]|uniref:hypothetical protein n=1 Tax=Bacillus paranthracis TaxID=2026186 RepID=UPI00397CD073
MAVLAMFSGKQDKKYNYARYIEEMEKEDDNQAITVLDKYLAPIIGATRKRIKISTVKEAELKRLFREANMNLDPTVFYTYKILYPVISVTFLILLGLAYDNKSILILALLAPLTYFYPDYNLKRNLKNAKIYRKLELPNYQMPLGVLLQTYTTYEAVKRSATYAGPHIRPFVEDMILELETWQGSTKPFKNFAEKLDIPEAHTFVVAIQQAIKTDPNKGREIIQQQIEVSRKLRDENYNSLILARPLLMNKYNVITVACILVIPLTMVGVTLMQAFSSI